MSHMMSQHHMSRKMSHPFHWCRAAARPNPQWCHNLIYFWSAEPPGWQLMLKNVHAVTTKYKPACEPHSKYYHMIIENMSYVINNEASVTSPQAFLISKLYQSSSIDMFHVKAKCPRLCLSYTSCAVTAPVYVSLQSHSRQKFTEISNVPTSPTPLACLIEILGNNGLKIKYLDNSCMPHADPV